jgi:hypothetical protein
MRWDISMQTSEKENSEELTNEERIKSMLDKTTGFPLELEIASILRSKGYQVYQNQLFEDEGTIREIDIEAILPTERSVIEQKWCLLSNLVVECKMSKKYSWVFYRNVDSLMIAECAQEIDPISLKFDRQNHLFHFGLFDRYFSEHVCSSRTVLDAAKGRVADRDDIFDAVNKVSRCVKRRLEEVRKAYRPDRGQMLFFFPVIVFDGPVYEAEHRSGTLSVKAVNKTILRVSVVSPLSGRLSAMYIDVVRGGHFASLISLIESKTNSVNETLTHKRIATMLDRASSAAGVKSSCQAVDLIASQTRHLTA